MATGGYPCRWGGALGILENRGVGQACGVSEDLLVAACVKIGMPENAVPGAALATPLCTVADLCDHPGFLAASAEDAQLLFHFLDAPDWCMKYWTDRRALRVWRQRDICVAMRQQAMDHTDGWSDGDVMELLNMFRKREWCTMCRSDVLALAAAMRTMTRTQRGIFTMVTTAAIKHTIQCSAAHLGEDVVLEMLADMVSAARTAGILEAVEIRSEINCACLAYVLAACGRELPGLHEDFFTWLYPFVCGQGWLGAWCEAVYGSMEPGKVVDEYLRHQDHGPALAAAWRRSIDTHFYKLWHFWNRHIHRAVDGRM